MPTSIQNRLTVGLIVTLTILLVGQWLLVSIAIKFTFENYVEAGLEHDVESLLGALSFDTQGKPLLKAVRLNNVYQTPLSGHYYQAQSNGHEVRSRSLWDVSLELESAATGGGQAVHRQGPREQRLLVLTRGYRKHGHDVTLQVAEDLSPVENDIQRLQVYYAVFSLVAASLLLLLQRRVVHNALRPLDKLREELTQLERGATSALSPDVPSEVLPLVDEINHLLALLTKRLERSRKVAGNLAHALKTPLTLLAQQADTPDLRPKVAGTIRDQSSIIRQLIDRELNRARLAGGELAYGANPRSVLSPLIDTLNRIYTDRGLNIEMEVPEDATTAIEQLDLLELLGNLLDNACKFAAHRVRLRYEGDGSERWNIEDDGPGCAPGQWEQLTKRGTRFDEMPGGHGLGLSIALDIVNDYGGHMSLMPSPELGGLLVAIDLPLAGGKAVGDNAR